MSGSGADTEYIPSRAFRRSDVILESLFGAGGHSRLPGVRAPLAFTCHDHCCSSIFGQAERVDAESFLEGGI